MAAPLFLAAIPALTGLLGSLLDGLSGEQRVKAEQAMKILEMAQQEAQGQQQVNQAEAAHRSIFVAGWRPFVGWVCGCGLAYELIIRPFLIWYLAAFVPDAPVPPSLGTVLSEMLFALLGIGSLRTFEKVKGVSK